MEAKQYTISEAAKKLHVGSHVLRFWEEELHLNIPRNEMGHRVYSEKEMKQLEQIINMKKDGFSLKDIEHKLSPKSSGQVIPYPVSESEISPNDKMIQFKTILSRIVSDAIRKILTVLHRILLILYRCRSTKNWIICFAKKKSQMKNVFVNWMKPFAVTRKQGRKLQPRK